VENRDINRFINPIHSWHVVLAQIDPYFLVLVFDNLASDRVDNFVIQFVGPLCVHLLIIIADVVVRFDNTMFG
jgi:hypothetical protein